MLQQKVYNAPCGWWICHCGFSVVNNIAYRERYVNEIHITISDSGLKSFLQKRFPIVEVPLESFQEADFFIGDTFSTHIDRFKGVRVLYTGENHPIDLNRFDYCLTHEFVENDRCHRFPYWQNVLMWQPELRAYLKGERPKVTPEELRERQTEFCAFVCRNAKGKERNAFVRALSKVRKVNCGGPFMNNIGYVLPRPYEVKREFQSRHCFSMAYENEAAAGYQTEKIIDAFVSGSIPLYWGNPEVTREFNPASFVHARDFRSRKEMIEYLLELADDPVRRAEMINADILQDSEVFEKADRALEEFFARIFERGARVIQRTRLQRFLGVAQNYYGHGLFRTLRYVSRRIRGKME